MNNILNVKDLTLRYGKNEVVKSLSFKVEEGDYLGIVGSNGSGKTTLINAILGLIEPVEGTIDFNKDTHIGYLPQKSIKNDKIFPAKVKEVVATGLLVQKKGFRFYSKEDCRKVDNILTKLKIYDLKDNKIGELSGGQQQRVLLARAMVASPKVLVLDEPTNYLDNETKEELYKILKELNNKENVTIIAVSHDLKTIGKYLDKILYLETELIFYGDYRKFLKSKDMKKYSNYMTRDD